MLEPALQYLGYPIFIIGPGVVISNTDYFPDRISHRHTHSGPPQHGEVIGHITKGDNF